MNYPISTLSTDSRVWVFTSSSLIEENTANQLILDTSIFLDNWLAHQQALKAGVDLLHNQFLIIAVDENHTGASGCSIDKLHSFVQQEEKKLNLKLLDRMRVVYKLENEINNNSVSELQLLLNEGKVTEQTIVFNPLIENLSDFKLNFEVQLKDTWLNRFVNKQKNENS